MSITDVEEPAVVGLALCVRVRHIAMQAETPHSSHSRPNGSLSRPTRHPCSSLNVPSWSAPADTARRNVAMMSRMQSRPDGWERRAADWLAWARTPDHDAYWRYRDAFFEMLPPPTGRALEIGCGEGRVTRDLTERGYRMTGLDASKTLVQAAADRDPDGDYIVGDAHELPFADQTFGLVVAYNVLMDVGDVPQVVREAGRVLVRGGCLCICVTHPLADAGEWEGGQEARFVITRSYLDCGPFEATVEKVGLRMQFDGFTHSLESYCRAIESAGLVIESLREPRPSGIGEPDARWAQLPMFLMLRCRKLPATSEATRRSARRSPTRDRTGP